MVAENKTNRRLKVAIIGGGPGGLGLAIELAKLDFVDWNLYEKKPQITETSGGMSLQPHTWRLLQLNGAAEYIRGKDFFRPADGLIEQRRNGRTGSLLLKTDSPDDIPVSHRTCRLIRGKLQAALYETVDLEHVHFLKRLSKVQKDLTNDRVRISFTDGSTDEVDLLVGADGIRSFIRNYTFPGHTLRYSGQCAYRTIVSQEEVRKIEGIPWAPIFWKSVSGLYVYTCPLGGDDFEVTARIRRPKEAHEQTSWGKPFRLETLLHEYKDFYQPIRELLALAAKGNTQEFAMFSGPRLQSVVDNGRIALIGDACHPQCGNFGAGVGFALEDGFTLAKAIEWAWSREMPLPEALDMYDSLRSAHYTSLYQIVDRFSTIKARLQEENLPIDEEIKERVKRISEATKTWMYYYEIDKVVARAIWEKDNGLGITPFSSNSTENNEGTKSESHF